MKTVLGSTRVALLLAALLTLAAATFLAEEEQGKAVSGQIEWPEEKHLRNIRQLTDGGENAEAYFSLDGKQLIFQSTRDGRECDQIYTMASDGSNQRMVSNGQGRCTCAYFIPNTNRIVYSSTYSAAGSCPPKPDYSQGYVWALYPGYDVFTAKADGSGIKQLTQTPGYDAEATISRDGKKIVFTSVRDGDLDIYTMSTNGSNLKRLTTELGYDGGPFFSYDGQWIVYRAYHPKTEKEIQDYKSLLGRNLIRPSTLDIWIMKADGTQKRQVTKTSAANFAPYLFPDGKKIIFASNMKDPRGRNFDLYTVNLDGSELERVTYNDTFDGFPMFNSNGTKIVFASNRNARKVGDTNIFIADWIP